MCHTEQMGEREGEREREAARGEDVWESALAFCIYPWRSSPGKRVECSLSLLSSIRLSGGGKSTEPIPQWIIPPTLLKPPHSHVHAALKHMYSLWRDTECSENTQTAQNMPLSVAPYPASPFLFFLSFFPFLLSLSFFQMSVHAQNTMTHTHANIYTYAYSTHTCTHDTHACTNTEGNIHFLLHTGLCTSCHMFTHTHTYTHTHTLHTRIQVSIKPRKWESILCRLRLTQAAFPVT